MYFKSLTQESMLPQETLKKKKNPFPVIFSEVQFGIHKTFGHKRDAKKNMDRGFNHKAHKRPCGTCRRLDVTTGELQGLILCRSLIMFICLL